MSQITGALIGITLVLTAVFIPMAFFSGSVGAIYRQFSLSLVSSMLFSVFLAMSLTPALCATMLHGGRRRGITLEKRGFFGWFNRGFRRDLHEGIPDIGWPDAEAGDFLHDTLRPSLSRSPSFTLRLPSSFLPVEDQGYFITIVQLPVGATQERTLAVLGKVEEYYLDQPEVRSLITVAGFSFNGRGQNAAIGFIRLKDWSERKGAEHSVQGVVGRAFAALSRVKDAIIFPMKPPPIPELGTVAGFDMQLQDRAGLGHDKLVEARDQLLAMAGDERQCDGRADARDWKTWRRSKSTWMNRKPPRSV